MKIVKLFLTSIFILSLHACGNGEKNNNTQTVELSNVSYHIPTNLNVVDGTIEGTMAKMMSSGTNQELVAFVQQLSTTSNTSKSSKVIRKGVETAFNQLRRSRGSIDRISLFSSQNFQTPYAFTIAHYKLKTNSEIEPLTLAGEIITTLSGGTAKGLPLASENAPVDTSFRLILLYGEYEASSFYIAVVVPEKSYSKYQIQSDSITNAARVLPKGQALTKSSENFTQASVKKNADILFVIDDSGSMSDNQNALSQAADDFSREMGNSGLSYRSAIITTSTGVTDYRNGEACSILRKTGIIMQNNTSLLKKSLVAGTNGSGTETGIWNAEQALQKANTNNNYVDGVISRVGMPKTGSTLSVIIISDEASQYRRRSNGVIFNPRNNLFINRNIRVYSLIETSQYALNNTQYDELSSQTGGIFSNIENKGTDGALDFRSFMQKIASDAGGAASSFVLSHPVMLITEVKVNGNTIQENATNGYTYLQSSKAIVFHGTSVPPSAANIEVIYEYYQN